MQQNLLSDLNMRFVIKLLIAIYGTRFVMGYVAISINWQIELWTILILDDTHGDIWLDQFKNTWTFKLQFI